MLFTSFPFVLFLSAVLAAYYLLPSRIQPFLILAANIVFYAFSGWQGMVCIAATCVSSWYAGLRIDALSQTGEAEADAAAAAGQEPVSGQDKKARQRELKAAKRRWMLAAVLFNLAILAVCKYTGFVTNSAYSFILPMGISFYTFKAVSYVVDAYRAKVSGVASRSLLRVAIFVSFFPEVVQGPISRYGELSKTLEQPHRFDAAEAAAGLRRVCFGFFKKLVVADRLLPAVIAISSRSAEDQGACVLAGIFLYAIALYADFTGGIDITIGTARMMGIRVAENFNSPYFAKSIMDYWRRWHISMGAWFRDYLFYPLNSSRLMPRLVSPVKRLFGAKAAVRAQVMSVTMILWLAIGAWHGASWNFIAWGAVNGVVILLHQELMPRYRRFEERGGLSKARGFGALQILLTFTLMAFINGLDLYFVPIFSGQVFTSFSGGSLASLLSEFGLAGRNGAVCAAGVCVMLAAGIWTKKFPDCRPGIRLCLIHSGLLCFVTLVFGCYGFGYEAKQFIYNQF